MSVKLGMPLYFIESNLFDVHIAFIDATKQVGKFLKTGIALTGSSWWFGTHFPVVYAPSSPPSSYPHVHIQQLLLWMSFKTKCDF